MARSIEQTMSDPLRKRRSRVVSQRAKRQKLKISKKSEQTKNKLIEALANCDLFKMLDDKHYTAIVAVMIQKTFHFNEVIISNGEEAKDIFILEIGSIEHVTQA